MCGMMGYLSKPHLLEAPGPLGDELLNSLALCLLYWRTPATSESVYLNTQLAVWGSVL